MIDWKEVREWITIAGAALAFGISLWQYRRAQAWKRAEWIASEMRIFFDDPRINNALSMLDWGKRYLPLLLKTPLDDEPRAFLYRGKDLLHALTSKRNRQQRPYTNEEISIRDCFDRLLDGLERIENFIKAGLVRHKELAPYLNYWMLLIGDKHNGRKPEHIIVRLWTYIDDYRYTGVQTLLGRFGYDITVRVPGHEASGRSADVVQRSNPPGALRRRVRRRLRPDTPR